MIPLSTFNVLVVVGVLLIVYSVIDHRNRLYANIPLAVVSGILFAYLEAAISTSAVYEIVGVTATAIRSPSAGAFFGFLKVLMFAYAAFMVYEVIDEEFKKKAILAKQKEAFMEEEE